jgi:hypothetical protein
MTIFFSVEITTTTIILLVIISNKDIITTTVIFILGARNKIHGRDVLHECMKYHFHCVNI